MYQNGGKSKPPRAAIVTISRIHRTSHPITLSSHYIDQNRWSQPIGILPPKSNEEASPLGSFYPQIYLSFRKREFYSPLVDIEEIVKWMKAIIDRIRRLLDNVYVFIGMADILNEGSCHEGRTLSDLNVFVSDSCPHPKIRRDRYQNNAKCRRESYLS